MWELDYKETWTQKNWWFWTVVLEKTLERPLDCKEIQPVHPKGDQSWVFIGRTNVEAETPILWPPDAKSWLIWKDPDAGKDWGREEKRTTEDEMVGWHHWLNGHGFGWTPGAGDRQGGLVCCSSLGRRVRHNWATELNWSHTVLSDFFFSGFLFPKEIITTLKKLSKQEINISIIICPLTLTDCLLMIKPIKMSIWVSAFECFPSKIYLPHTSGLIR